MLFLLEGKDCWNPLGCLNAPAQDQRCVRLQDRMFSLAFLRMLEICSLKDIFTDRAVANPSVSWKNRIKLKLKQCCTWMGSVDSGVICFHCWLGTSTFAAFPFPSPCWKVSKARCSPCTNQLGVALPVFTDLYYSQSFLGLLAHT